MVVLDNGVDQNGTTTFLVQLVGKRIRELPNTGDAVSAEPVLGIADCTEQRVAPAAATKHADRPVTGDGGAGALARMLRRDDGPVLDLVRIETVEPGEVAVKWSSGCQCSFVSMARNEP